MNNKAFTISIALAAMAVFMIYSYITSKEEEARTRYGTDVAVIVAKKDITELAEINETMIDIVKKPKQFVEPGRTVSKEEVVGFIATVPIRKGEQITLNKITAPGVRTGLSKQITPGKRAIAIPVGDDNAVNRLLKPGDRIDILATIDPPGAQKGNQITKIVQQDVPVLAVGEYVTTQAPRKVEKDDTTGKDYVRNLNIDRSYSTITVEVDPQSAQQLTLLRDTSRLSVILRNNDDTERVNVGGAMLTDIMGTDTGRIVRMPSAQR